MSDRCRAPGCPGLVLSLACLLGTLAPAVAVAVLPGAPLSTRWEPPAGEPAFAGGFSDIALDHRGLLYLAGPRGIVELDGHEWRLVSLPRLQGSANLAIDSIGRVWVAAEGVAGFLAPTPGETLEYRSLVESFPELEPHLRGALQVLAARDGTVYLVGVDAVVWTRAGRSGVVPAPAPIRAATIWRERLVVALGSDRLLRLDGEAWTELARSPDHASLEGTLLGLVTLADGTLVAIGSGVVQRHDTAAALWSSNEHARSGPRRGSITAWCPLEDGALALGTEYGELLVVEASGALRQVLEPDPSYAGEPVTALAEDAEGGLWAVFGRELWRTEIHLPMTRWGRSEGLRGTPVSVLPAPGSVFVATQHGVFRFRADDEGAGPLDPVATSELGACFDLAALGGDLIAACRSGTWLVRGSELQLLVDGEAWVLTSDPARPASVWLGHSGGIARLHRENQERWVVTPLEGFEQPARGLAATRDGGLLVASSTSGLVAVDPTGRRQIRTLSLAGPDQTATLWAAERHGVLATVASGIQRLDLGQQRFVPLDGLDSEIGWVGPLAEAADGTLWFVAREGLWALAPGELAPSLRLPARGRFDPAGVTTVVPVGRTLWLGTHDGLLRLWTTTPLRPRSTPRVLLRRLLSSDGRQVFSEGAFADAHGAPGPDPRTPHRIGPDRPSLRVEVAAPRWDSRNELRFRYRLLGATDPGWSAWTAASSRELGRLEAGSYRLEAQARDGSGLESPITAWDLELLPRWHETGWFRFALMIVSLTGLAATLRATARWARNRALAEALEERRGRELREARTLQQSMLPSAAPEIPGLEIAADHRTASEVGGDYWDVFPQEPGRAYVAIGDATGHGLGAGLMVAATRTALLTVEEARDPPAVLRRLDRVLRRFAGARRTHMALALVELTRTERGWSVVLASAGVPPPFVLRSDGSIEELVCPGLPLGTGMPREHHTVCTALHFGEALVLFTDGLFERSTASGDQLGWDGLTELLHDLGARLRRSGGRLDAASLLALLLAEWEARCPATGLLAEGEDDVTVVVVRCTPDSRGGLL
jgi:hypothetical protein